ncbi:hypothetical protein GCK72_018439 [Caenorhabditis remanei]|uniref:Uncharacterized protein n=1 Tax=Caenorhabditis remanei TaxID=31234 RepID=A0A6A5GB98_CAERE|nr:hypothetical protein GCK72_018439 [Caenorhabditis remanei]KAF1751885.1 hypothetical protein GCK72_018439 [Caenorhabditis remanei]
MIRYFRCIKEIDKTTTGIVNLYNEAADVVDKTDEFKIIIQSMQTRLYDLHQNLLTLFKLSIYKIDFSVRERKYLAKKILVLVKELWKDTKETAEGNPFGFNNIESKIEILVKDTDDLTKLI